MTSNKQDEQYNMLPDKIIPWYKENARDLPWRKNREPYSVWLSEIMLQQTRVEAVKGYYRRFLKELPTIKTLAEVDEEKLLKLWEGLGYYNRARNLQKAAKKIMEENNGRFPSEYNEIIELPGIGEYTAGAIASTCFDEPVAAVDGNVLRVVSRITADYDDITKTATKRKIKLALETVYPKKNCGEFTQGLMELGAMICLPSGVPKCEICPMKEGCISNAKGIQQELPIKTKKKDRRVEERTVFVLISGDQVAVDKRPDNGLLAGLWEFPNVAGKLSLEEAVKTAEDWHCQPVQIEKKLERKHIFTHVEWHMTCYYLRCSNRPGQFTWVSHLAVSEKVALPTAFKQFWGNS